jgi:hypothetical protein
MPRKLEKPLTVKASDRVFLRLYPDCKPHKLEIADLQKGLVLMLGASELVGEGIGFGAPVIRYADKTFFSKSAEVSVQGQDEGGVVVSKSFLMDAVSRKRICRGPFISDNLYSFFHRAFMRGYEGCKDFRPFFDKIMELRKILGIKSQFVEVNPRGRVNIVYKCFSDTVQIEVDLRALDKSGCEEILILNEQDSSFFRRYFDTSGLELFGRQIGAWEKVEADEASFSDINGHLTFSLKRLDQATLFRGWEEVKGRFSWAGLGYSLKPNISTFTYLVKISMHV